MTSTTKATTINAPATPVTPVTKKLRIATEIVAINKRINTTIIPSYTNKMANKVAKGQQFNKKEKEIEEQIRFAKSSIEDLILLKRSIFSNLTSRQGRKVLNLVNYLEDVKAPRVNNYKNKKKGGRASKGLPVVTVPPVVPVPLPVLPVPPVPPVVPVVTAPPVVVVPVASLLLEAVAKKLKIEKEVLASLESKRKSELDLQTKKEKELKRKEKEKLFLINKRKKNYEKTLKAAKRKKAAAKSALADMKNAKMNVLNNKVQYKKQVTLQEVVVWSNQNGTSIEYSVETTKMSESALSRENIRSQKLYMTSGKNRSVVNAATRKVIVFDFSGMTEFPHSDIYGYYKGNARFFIKKGESFFEIGSNKASKIEERSLTHYKLVGNAPSGTRKMKSIGLVDDGSIGQVIDSITSGMYSQSEGKELGLEALTKVCARLFQGLAPSKSLGQCRYGVYIGKFGQGSQDGIGYAMADFMATGMNLVGGLKSSLMYKEEDLVGVMAQARVGSSKVAVTCLKRGGKFMNVIYSAIGGIDNVVELDHTNSADVDELKRAMDGKPSTLCGKLVTIGAIKDVDFISDLNGYKGAFAIDETQEFRLLDIVNPTRAVSFVGGANTSLQALSSPLFSGASNIIAFLDRKMSEKASKLVTGLKSRDAQPYTCYGSEKIHAKGMLESMLPTVASTEARFMRSSVDAILKGFANDIHKARVSVDGGFMRLLPDPAALLGTKVLDMNECYVPGVEEFFASMDLSGLNRKERRLIKERILSVFKYPKIGPEEFALLKNVSLRELLLRIEKEVTSGRITQSAAEGLKEFLSNLKAGAIMLPAFEILLKKLAGSDFDWDGATIFLDPRFNCLLPEANSYVDIRSAKPKASKNHIFGVDTLIVPFKNMICSKAESIGVITNNIALAQGLRAKLITEGGAAGKTSKKVAKMLLSMTDGHSAPGCSYEPLPYEEVVVPSKYGADIIMKRYAMSEEISKIVASNIALCDVTIFENQLKILEDLNVVYRFYQESTIDAPKTSVIVEVLLDPSTTLHNLINNKCEFTLEGGKVKFNNNDFCPEKKEGFEDLIYLQRRVWAERLIYKITPAISDLMDKIRIEAEAQGLEVLNKVSGVGVTPVDKAKIGRAIGDLKQLSHYYGDIVSSYLAELEKEDLEDDNSGMAKERFLDRIAVLRGTARKVTSYANAIQRGIAAKYLSSWQEIGKPSQSLRVEPSSFYSSVFPEEFMLDITSNNGYIDVSVAGDVSSMTEGAKLRFEDGQYGDLTLSVDEESFVDSNSPAWNTGLFEAYNKGGAPRARRKIEFFGDKLELCSEEVAEGAVITFKNGVALDESAVCRNRINGTFLIQAFAGSLYATTPIVDVMKANYEASLGNQEIIVRLKPVNGSFAQMLDSVQNSKIVGVMAETVRDIPNYFIYDEVGTAIAGVDCDSRLATLINRKKGGIKEVIVTDNKKGSSVMIVLNII